MDKRPVFYFTRMVPSYRVPVLEQLHVRLDKRLVVCAGQAPGTSSLEFLTEEEAGQFHRLRLRNYWLKGETFHMQPFTLAFRTYGQPSVILAEESPRSASLPFLLHYAGRRGIGRVLWGHFSSNSRPFSSSSLADRYRIWLARSAEACVCYTEAIADLLKPYVLPERLFVARNTLDTDTLFRMRAALAQEGKAATRRRLDLPGDRPVLVFIGRLTPEKGTEMLLDVFKALSATRPAHLLVIGDGPARGRMEARVAQEHIENVRFLGALAQWETSAPYLYAADVMLMPGYLGLAVNHAFALGVPVVSQAAPPGIRFHSPEIAYVQQGVNGMLSAYGDTEAMLKAVVHVLSNQHWFSDHALAYARSHLTLDQMIDGLEAAVRFAETRSPRLTAR